MSDVEEITRNLLRDRPQLLAPVLRAMITLSDRGESNPKAGFDEFCREWIASHEPSTPRTLRIFLKAGLINASPRGSGNHRRFYAMTDPTASEHALPKSADAAPG